MLKTSIGKTGYSLPFTEGHEYLALWIAMTLLPAMGTHTKVAPID
jgi:hypothetical protein